MFGDPHVLTFDGAAHEFMNSELNHFWAVKTPTVKIQGYATTAQSWMQGIAVSGFLIGFHELVAYRNPASWNDFKVIWDGQQILSASGQSFNANGVALSRNLGAGFIPPDDELDKMFSRAASAKNFFNKDLVMEEWKTNSNILSFKLKENVEIFMIWSIRLPGDAVEVLIKMPNFGSQGGWCGNFDGNPGNDPSSNEMGRVPEDEDLFKKTWYLIC
jgi:hypothetical protein